jgi:hypothetical protein
MLDIPPNYDIIDPYKERKDLPFLYKEILI